jgi:hypothetical protein
MMDGAKVAPSKSMTAICVMSIAMMQQCAAWMSRRPGHSRLCGSSRRGREASVPGERGLLAGLLEL